MVWKNCLVVSTCCQATWQPKQDSRESLHWAWYERYQTAHLSLCKKSIRYSPWNRNLILSQLLKQSSGLGIIDVCETWWWSGCTLVYISEMSYDVLYKQDHFSSLNQCCIWLNTLLSALSLWFYSFNHYSSIYSFSPSHYCYLFEAVGYRPATNGKLVWLFDYCMAISVMMINTNKGMLDCLWWSSHSKKEQDRDSATKSCRS